MTAYETFEMMFYSPDTMYDESTMKIQTKVLDYLSGLNPFLFEGVGSVDPAEYDKFKSAFSKVFPTDLAEPKKAYEFCKEYLKKVAPIEVKKRLRKSHLRIGAMCWRNLGQRPC